MLLMMEFITKVAKVNWFSRIKRLKKLCKLGFCHPKMVNLRNIAIMLSDFNCLMLFQLELN